MKSVRVIFRKKSAVLVEYMKGDLPVRVSIPADKIHISEDGKEGTVAETILKIGIPYGIPWGKFIPDARIDIPGERIEEELHKQGIWTAEDFKQNPGAAQSAVLSVAANIVRSIMQVVKEYSSKEV